MHENTATAEAEAPAGTPVPPPSAAERLAAEVDEAIASTLEPEQAATKAPASAPDASVEAHSEAEPAKPDAATSGPSEGALERAVRAGFTLAQAKNFPGDDLLNATCARIEGVSGAGSPEGASGAESGGEAKPADVNALLSEIPDLSPDDYDEQIVNVVRLLKGVVKQQGDALAELRGARSQDWFTVQAEGVKDFVKGDPAKAADLREKFDVLKAGYKAAGKTVTDEAAFSEAARLVLGGDMEAARLKKQASAAQKRNGQIIPRVTASNVAPDMGDPIEAVAAEIDRKFFAR